MLDSQNQRIARGGMQVTTGFNISTFVIAGVIACMFFFTLGVYLGWSKSLKRIDQAELQAQEATEKAKIAEVQIEAMDSERTATNKQIKDFIAGKIKEIKIQNVTRNINGKTVYVPNPDCEADEVITNAINSNLK